MHKIKHYKNFIPNIQIYPFSMLQRVSETDIERIALLLRGAQFA